jgi:hypothetical protein
MREVHYNDKKIILSYSQTADIYEHIKNKKIRTIKGSGNKKIRLEYLSQEEYKFIEETALAYLLKNAMKREDLISIIRIKQNVISTPVNDCIELEIRLEGKAVYSNRN